MESSTMSNFAPPVGPPSTAQLLRLAIQNFACHPQAQRRYVQMGWMDRAVENLTKLAADSDALAAEGELSGSEIELIVGVRDQLEAALAANPDLLERERRAPREFLFTNALENESWDRIRERARIAHHQLSGDKSVFVSINAK
jgi:hypothetical protein